MSSSITFILNNRKVTLDFNQEDITPTTTVLNYLRQMPEHRGVKEGCAEGDCGACTVVLADMNDQGELRYRAVDSCLLFLPMLHGKQLITVENLRSPEGKLHPVQQAMVELHGAQCGFCTPGIIMSLFALYKNHVHPSREIVEDALTGNLCRCTGYRPIVEAALKACNGKPDHFTENEIYVKQLLSETPLQSLKLQNADQLYYRPSTLPEALLFKAEHPQALLISGATDVALRVTKKNERIPEIIDLSGIRELREFTVSDDHVILGAGLPLSEVVPFISADYPALADMLKVYGSLQIRNMGTIAGSLGTASPIGDLLPVMMAYGGKVILESVHGKRKVDFDHYLTGYRQSVRTNEEVITAVKIRKPPSGTIVRSYKVSKRKDLDISTVSAGFRLRLNPDRHIEDIALVYGGMAAMVRHASETECFLKGKAWKREIVEEAMSYMDRDFQPISDARAEAPYRSRVAKNLLLKFWSETYS